MLSRLTNSTVSGGASRFRTLGRCPRHTTVSWRSNRFPLIWGPTRCTAHGATAAVQRAKKIYAAIPKQLLDFWKTRCREVCVPVALSGYATPIVRRQTGTPGKPVRMQLGEPFDVWMDSVRPLRLPLSLGNGVFSESHFVGYQSHPNDYGSTVTGGLTGSRARWQGNAKPVNSTEPPCSIAAEDVKTSDVTTPPPEVSQLGVTTASKSLIKLNPRYSAVLV